MGQGSGYGDPEQNETGDRAAGDRPRRAGYPAFGVWAAKLLDNGYEPLPIVPGAKRPAPKRWSQVPIDHSAVATWSDCFPDHGIGLRTGRIAALDIDVCDPDMAHAVERLAIERLGESLLRVGQWPKRLLLYRAREPFAKAKSGPVEWLGLGQQLVAFGIHPGTGRPYSWPGESPFEVPANDLPPVSEAEAHAVLAEARALLPVIPSRTHKRSASPEAGSDAPIRDGDGRVVDGRDGWLSRIAFHVVHDALDRGETLDPDRLAMRVWERFADTADLTRPRKNGRVGYSERDARAKIGDKLRLHHAGLLPAREAAPVEAEYDLPDFDAGLARARLDEVIGAFCENVFAWHEGNALLPKLAVRATVGLGKSRAARSHLLPLAARLREAGLPHRVLVFTATHALAEETAVAWRKEGAEVAVLRGYERTDPVTGEPMCRDVETVTAAFLSGLSAQTTICAPRDGARCRYFETCAKQQNRRDVAAADVVVAPYDALFSGLAFETDDIALLVVDEAVWPRALKRHADVFLEDLASEPVSDMAPGSVGRGPLGAMADLNDLRHRLARGISRNGAGPLRRSHIVSAGLCPQECHRAARLETWRKQDPGLRADLTGAARLTALAVATRNARVDAFVAIWRELASFLETGQIAMGQLRLHPPDAKGRHRIDLRRVKHLHESLRQRPVLHLDATFREPLAVTVLRGMETREIEAATPHQRLRLVTGSFGKSMLCPEPGLAPDEASRRQNRLGECIDYVRWQALRHGSGGVLVVTYQAIEDAFRTIPQVETLHFNAVAGLDRYKDVSCLVVIGRPLPSHHELEALAGGYFGVVGKAGYTTVRTGVRMRSGECIGVRVIRHRDEIVEQLRAAICDDELVQAIGRGRGVNRTTANPLDVHVLADVALPLVHDVVTSWEVEAPDIFQRMLLGGVAVDSPADAAALHPALFGNEKQAQKMFERCGFKRQTPMKDTYREMSLKSTAYRRIGRGRSWQRCWWVKGEAVTLRERLEQVLGRLDGWQPSGCGE